MLTWKPIKGENAYAADGANGRRWQVTAPQGKRKEWELMGPDTRVLRPSREAAQALAAGFEAAARFGDRKGGRK